MLIALIERRERVVTKEELLDLVWPSVTVEEGNVAYTISMIRRLLGHDVVQTVSKLGYRFVGVLEADAIEAASRTNLSPRQSVLIGRQADQDRLDALLLEHPLVSVVGPPGVGKTSLVKMVARRALDRLERGVWFLDAANLADPAAMAAAIGSLIGMKLRPTEDIVTELVNTIGTSRMMVILDGCEAAQAASASLAGALVDRCPGISILVTSRRPLQSPGERVLRLKPLRTSGTANTLAEAVDIPAVALFIHRAEAAHTEFRLSDLDAGSLAALCRTLDGLPLALEMVAARAPAIGLDILQSRLADVVLRTGSPLRSALDLSWSLLDARERVVLAALSVFSGSFDFSAALSVVHAEAADGQLIGCLGGLVDQSLLVAEGDRGRRYRLLDTVRSYLADHLTPTERHRLHGIAASHYAVRMTTADNDWNHRAEAPWRDELAPDIDNLRAALDWAFSAEGECRTGLILAGRCAQLWWSLGLHGEARRWLERATDELTERTVEPEIAAGIWRGLGGLLSDTDPARAATAFTRAADLYKAAGDGYGQGRALAGKGMLALLSGATDRAERTLLKAKSLLARARQPRSYSSCLGSLAFLYVMTDRKVDAVRSLHEGLRAARESTDPAAIAKLEFNLAELSFIDGEARLAAIRAEAAIEQLKRARSPLLSWGLLNLAVYLEASGDAGRARQVAAEALPLALSREDEVLVSLMELIALLRVQADPALSAGLLTWSDGTKVRQSRPRQSSEVAIYERALAAQRGALDGATLATALAEGTTWTGAEAADAANRLLQIPEATAPRSGQIIPFPSAV